MKKLTYLFILISSLVFSQTSGITYQAVIYNPSGEELPGYDNMYSPLTNQQICLHFSIIDQNGNLEYMEEATLMTDSFGMVNTVIGSHIQVDGYASGFNGILWDGNPKSLKVDLDIKGQCAMFEELSNQPFTYVPFALYSANPGNPGPQGEPGEDGVGIASTVDNNNGTFTINYTDGSSFTTLDLTGPQGIQGEQGPIGPTGLTGPQGVQGPPGNDGADGLNGTDGVDGQDGVGIASTVDNNNGTFTINYTDGSSFTTADLTGPQGAQGIQGEQGPIGPTGLTGPQGVQGPPGIDGVDGLNGTDGADGQDGVGIATTVDNNNGTFTINYTDGSSFTTADLTGPQGIQGEQGPIGPTGLTGPQGVQGLPGNDGVDGLNGTDGADGQDGVGIASTVDNNDGTFTLNFTDGSSFTTADLTGPQGAQGIQGEQGPTGPTGLTGPQGVQGPPGNDGADGLNGTDGADGQDGVGIASTVDNNDGTFTLNFTDGSSFTTADLTGPQGIQGEQGPIGPTGLTGPQGVQGPPGNDGADGLNGTDGADGQDGVGIASTVDNNDGTFTLNFTDGSSFTTADLTGPQGIQGEQGPIGPTGLTGPQGVQGPPGNNGIDGLNGQDGADGLSAYDVWLSLGNTGTEQDFIDSLTGPSGNGIQSTTDNGDGTFTFDYTDGTSFTTIDLTGPEGPPGTDSSSSDNCITEISNDCITEISNISDVEMSQGDAANYCRDLTLNGYTDWRLPTLDEYMRLRSMINFPDSYYNGSIHTATYDYANYHAFFLIHELTLKTGRSNFSGTYYNAKCRCVR